MTIETCIGDRGWKELKPGKTIRVHIHGRFDSEQKFHSVIPGELRVLDTISVAVIAYPNTDSAWAQIFQNRQVAEMFATNPGGWYLYSIEKLMTRRLFREPEPISVRLRLSSDYV